MYCKGSAFKTNGIFLLSKYHDKRSVDFLYAINRRAKEILEIIHAYSLSASGSYSRRMALGRNLSLAKCLSGA